MGAHSRQTGAPRRVLDPIFLGACLVGMILVVATLLSQEAPPVAASIEPRPVVGELLPSPVQTYERAAARMSPSVPVALEINAIDVRSPLHPVGLEDDGTIETPEGVRYDEAAWYKHSPTPGSVGPSIILGHVDSAANGPSIFFRLGDLERGDEVLVTRADGTIARFSVDSVHRYAKVDFPTKLVYGDLDHAGLRLVTCGGAFDEVAGHYLDNVVVFASLVSPLP